jgi:hypothetical protein
MAPQSHPSSLFSQSVPSAYSSDSFWQAKGLALGGGYKVEYHMKPLF